MLPHLVYAQTPRGEMIFGDVDREAVFWMASLTKLITSFCVLILVDQGKIDLDAPIESLKDTQVFVNGALENAKSVPTMRQLLTHTAGFSYPMWNKDYITYAQIHNIPSHATTLRRSLDMPLVHQPGSKFEYGINLDIAGLEIQRVTGMTLANAFEAMIFKPLGMKNTTFTLSDAQKTRVIPMHSRLSGELKQIPFSTPDPQEQNMGGGGLWGTANDYMKMLNCVMHYGAPLISKKLYIEAARNQMGDLFVSFEEAVTPNVITYEPMKEVPKKHGLFSVINMEDKPNGRKAMSVSWAGLANCYWWVDHQSGVKAICVAQLFPYGDSEIVTLFENFEKQIYASL